MTLEEMRAAIAEAKARPIDPEARHHLVMWVVRAREPRQRIRILPGVMAEVIGTEPAPFRATLAGDGFDVRPGGVRVFCRVFVDDLERYLDRVAS